MSTRRSQADSSGPRCQMTQTKPLAEPRKAPRVAASCDESQILPCMSQTQKPSRSRVRWRAIPIRSPPQASSSAAVVDKVKVRWSHASEWQMLARRRVCMRFMSSSRLGLRAWRSSIGQQQPRPAAESPGCDATTQEDTSFIIEHGATFLRHASRLASSGQ